MKLRCSNRFQSTYFYFIECTVIFYSFIRLMVRELSTHYFKSGDFLDFLKCWELLLGVKMSYREIKKNRISRFWCHFDICNEIKNRTCFRWEIEKWNWKKNFKIFIDDHSKIFFEKIFFGLKIFFWKFFIFKIFMIWLNLKLFCLLRRFSLQRSRTHQAKCP